MTDLSKFQATSEVAPERYYTPFMVKAELAIREAKLAVGELNGVEHGVLLMEAQDLLDEAQCRVAEFVNKLRQRPKPIGSALAKHREKDALMMAKAKEHERVQSE